MKPNGQPPLERNRRADGSRPAWVGLLLAVAGMALIAAGAMAVHIVGAPGRTMIGEPQLVRDVTVDAVHRLPAGAESPLAVSRPAVATSQAGAKPGAPGTEKRADDYCPT